jgi:hypothetical protein
MHFHGSDNMDVVASVEASDRAVGFACVSAGKRLMMWAGGVFDSMFTQSVIVRAALQMKRFSS